MISIGKKDFKCIVAGNGVITEKKRPCAWIKIHAQQRNMGPVITFSEKNKPRNSEDERK